MRTSRSLIESICTSVFRRFPVLVVMKVYPSETYGYSRIGSLAKQERGVKKDEKEGLKITYSSGQAIKRPRNRTSWSSSLRMFSSTSTRP